MISCSEAIKVSQNLCGFLPATVELRSEIQGHIFLNFGDFEVMENPKVIEGALFLKDYKFDWNYALMDPHDNIGLIQVNCKFWLFKF